MHGLVTQIELTAVRDSSAYTDRVRLRDILGDHRSFTSPVTTMAEAEHAMRSRRLGALRGRQDKAAAPWASSPSPSEPPHPGRTVLPFSL